MYVYWFDYIRSAPPTQKNTEIRYQTTLINK